MGFVMGGLRRPFVLARRFRHRKISTDSLWARADAAIATGKAGRAEEMYVSISCRKPVSASDHLLTGLALYRLGRPDPAIELLEQGYRRFPTDPLLTDNYLRIGLELGQAERIVRTVDPTAGQLAVERLVREFSDWYVRVDLIGYCLRAGLPALAGNLIAAANEACDSVGALWRLSDELLATGRRGEAENIYRRLSSRPPDSPDAFLYSALSFERLQLPVEAVDLLEAGLGRYPAADYLAEHQIRICLASDQMEKVIGHSERDAASDPAVCEALFDRFPNPSFRVGLIEYCLRKGQLAVAKRRLLMDGDQPFSSSDLWRIGDQMTMHGQVSEAAEIHRTLLAAEKRQSLDFYFAALSALRLGDSDRCLGLLEQGQESSPGASELRDLYLQICAARFEYDRYSTFRRRATAGGREVRSIAEFYEAAAVQSPEAFILNYKEIEVRCSYEEFGALKEAVLASLKRTVPTRSAATLLLFFARYLSIDDVFTRKLWELLRGQRREASAGGEGTAQQDERALDIVYRLTTSTIPSEAGRYERELDEFMSSSILLARDAVELNAPIADMTNHWAPWQQVFCNGDPGRYSSAISALEDVAFKTWPKLNFRASHIHRNHRDTAHPSRRIRIGFIVLDAMPMMSGLLSHLDRSVFETVFLRPGAAGQSYAARTWLERAERVVEFSDQDTYAAIDTIAREQLDIIVSGPSVGAVFFPMMARLAPLQMVLLEPNWTDGLTNTDYYISWQPAEPARPADYYRSAVALLEHPPYWIERPKFEGAASEAARTEVRRRLLGAGPEDRIYLCANTPPKIHPDMDDMFLSLLEADPEARLVILRGEYPPAKTLKSRIFQKLGAHRDRVLFLPTLKQDDAHRLLQSVDCCLDSFPICGMSSSFDASLLGVPLVTLPSETPFGRWTATIYEYIGVSGLTAKDTTEYLAMARRLARDRPWRDRIGAEIREKSSLFVESALAASEFQEFVTRAWTRHLAGLPPTDWIGNAWQQPSPVASGPRQNRSTEANLRAQH